MTVATQPGGNHQGEMPFPSRVELGLVLQVSGSVGVLNGHGDRGPPSAWQASTRAWAECASADRVDQFFGYGSKCPR
jgi:hypothetical protein